MKKVTEIPPGYYDTAPNYPAERVDEMQELGLQLGDAHAEIRLLKADAERYRAYRKALLSEDDIFLAAMTKRLASSWENEDDLDDAIDAAIAQQKETP